jgi:hypothetical protein
MVSPSVTRVTSYCPANEEAGFTKRKARMARNRTDLRIWQILIKCNPSGLLAPLKMIDPLYYRQFVEKP